MDFYGSNKALGLSFDIYINKLDSSSQKQKLYSNFYVSGGSYFVFTISFKTTNFSMALCPH